MEFSLSKKQEKYFLFYDEEQLKFYHGIFYSLQYIILHSSGVNVIKTFKLLFIAVVFINYNFLCIKIYKEYCCMIKW